jgi:AcrR family transcriptional regulator
MTSSTRDRLIDAGIELFANQGFEATQVGEIEAAAGFVARGGTLYKHFPSKLALLEAALTRHVDAVAQFDQLLSLLPLADVRSELQLLGRWMLGELDRQKAVTRVIEKDGHLVGPLVDIMREAISETGYRYARAYLDMRLVGQHWDRDALVVLLLGSLINLRRSNWTFTKPPMGLDDTRVINTWVEVALMVFAASEP